MRRVSTAILLAGALTCASGVAITERTGFAKISQGSCAAAFALLGLIVVLGGSRRWVIEACSVSSIGVLGVLIATSNPLGMAPLFYLWPIVFIAYFCSVRLLAFAYGLMVTTLPIALALNSTYDLKLDAFTGTISSVGLMAALIVVLGRREEALRERLALAAHTDPLTGLLNRRAFDPALQALIARSGPVSLVMIDIDHFKRFNDDHGHLAGDDALCRVADLLEHNSAAGDLVGRFGGEEFAVALSGAGVEGARRYAERVGEVLRTAAIDPRLHVSISAGIAAREPGADTVAALLARADEALYAAKRGGRARAAWWDGTIHVGASTAVEPPRAAVAA